MHKITDEQQREATDDAASLARMSINMLRTSRNVHAVWAVVWAVVAYAANTFGWAPVAIVAIIFSIGNAIAMNAKWKLLIERVEDYDDRFNK